MSSVFHCEAAGDSHISNAGRLHSQLKCFSRRLSKNNVFSRGFLLLFSLFVFETQRIDSCVGISSCLLGLDQILWGLWEERGCFCGWGFGPRASICQPFSADWRPTTLCILHKKLHVFVKQQPLRWTFCKLIKSRSPINTLFRYSAVQTVWWWNLMFLIGSCELLTFRRMFFTFSSRL